jgi:tetratricopeptide (TPR) repeat protein
MPLRAAWLALALGLPAWAAPEWLYVHSTHFELYTTAGAGTGRRAILFFEQVRGFFEKATGLRSQGGVETRIVVFRSGREYRPYRFNEFASAYYTGGRDRDFIVIGRVESGRDPTVVHEYLHLLIRHSGVKLPVWLEEGYAQLYSSLTPVGDRIQVGGVPPSVGATLSDKIWLKLDRLLAVDHDSPEYKEKDHAGIFYAQSWALTHLLNLDEAYRTRTRAFLEALQNGASSADAFRQVYGKSLPEVSADLNRYVRAAAVPAALFPFQLDKAAEAPEVRPASEWESGLVLAGVLEAIKKREEAGQAYQNLQQKFPNRWEAPAALGYLAWRAGEQDPRPHFARAAELGPTDPRFYYDYALLVATKDSSHPDRIALLQRAVDLKPDFDEAHQQLGYALLQARRYQQALSHFAQIRTAPREQLTRLYHATALAHLQLGQVDAARRAADTARKHAQTPEETAVADRLIAVLNRPAPAAVARSQPPPEQPNLAPSPPEPAPPELRRDPSAPRTAPAPAPPPPATVRVEGILERFECLGAVARLHVTAGGRRVVFAILDPKAVVVNRVETGGFEFSCGPQKPNRVIIEHDGRPEPKLGAAGVVGSIEFLPNP